MVSEIWCCAVYEMRRIVFSDMEIATALKKVMKQRGENVPDKVNPVVMVGRDMQSRPKVLLAYTHVQPSLEVTFSNQEVLAALLLKCMAEKVPMPKDAEKSLEIVDGFMALSVKYGDIESVEGAA